MSAIIAANLGAIWRAYTEATAPGRAAPAVPPAGCDRAEQAASEPAPIEHTIAR